MDFHTDKANTSRARGIARGKALRFRLYILVEVYVVVP